jgi:large subunit ribosomal protein L4
MLKVSVKNLKGDVVGETELSTGIFQAPVRKDIITRVIVWQLAKRRSGNHKTKEIGDVSGTTRKPYKQKGTGRARQGSLRSPQFRGGAVIFGPVVRDHGFSLPKKVRKMGLRCALSARFLANNLTIVDQLSVDSPKTKEIIGKFPSSVLLVGGEQVCANLKNAVANLHKVNILPRHGLNVYDIIKHDHVILSKEAVAYLEDFLGEESSADAA